MTKELKIAHTTYIRFLWKIQMFTAICYVNFKHNNMYNRNNSKSNFWYLNYDFLNVELVAERTQAMKTTKNLRSECFTRWLIWGAS